MPKLEGQFTSTAEPVKELHRGMAITIEMGSAFGVETHSVIVKSRYTLKSGDVRVKFVGNEKREENL